MSDNPFFLRVAATADRFSMLPPGRVTVCLSGGADSVALLRVLLELRERYALTVAAVHVHHGIRGDEASRDERFCRALCERLATHKIRATWRISCLAWQTSLPSHAQFFSSSGFGRCDNQRKRQTRGWPAAEE